jgi:hypothetical protein
MDILAVSQPFVQYMSPESVLTITIGKYVGKTFHPNNKIFFDFLKTYLNKNGWFIAEQYLSKKAYYHGTPHVRKCTLAATPSVVLGLDVPVTHTTDYLTTLQEHQYIYTGTYFDIHCHQAHVQAIEENLNFCVGSEDPPEEISIMRKHLCGLEVVFAVSHSQPPIYSVQVRLASLTELDKEALKALFTVIELAMCKYKKIDKTFSSVFM